MHALYNKTVQHKTRNKMQEMHLPLLALPYHATRIWGTTTWTSWVRYSVPSAIRSTRSRTEETYCTVLLCIIATCWAVHY